MSNFHEAFYRKAKELIPDFLFDQVKSEALPLSGAEARWKSSAPTIFERIVLPDLQNKLGVVKNAELKTLLRRVNKLFVSARRGKEDTDVFRKAAAWVVKEMRERGLTIDHKLAVLQQFIGKSDDEIAEELNLELIEKNGRRDNMGAPISERGFNASETLQMVEENGKWGQEQANYKSRSMHAEKTCGGCRFFLRDESSSVGRCQVVDGPINWFGTSDFHIDANQEAEFAFAIMRHSAQEAMMDAAFGVAKAYEAGGTDDDNNTDPQKPKMTITAKELVQKRIKREGSEYVVTDSSGKKELGRHKTRAEAVRQLQAIEASKKREAEKGDKKKKTEYAAKGQPTVGQVGERTSPSRDPKVDEELERLSKEEVELQVPIAKIDDEKRKVYGIVLEPDEVDTQGDTITIEEIEKAAEGFMKKARRIGLRHNQIAKGVTLTDSYVTQGPTTLGKTSLKKGTWIIGVKVENDAIWKGVKSGEFTGFSVGGFGKRQKNA